MASWNLILSSFIRRITSDPWFAPVPDISANTQAANTPGRKVLPHFPSLMRCDQQQGHGRGSLKKNCQGFPVGKMSRLLALSAVLGATALTGEDAHHFHAPHS